MALDQKVAHIALRRPLLALSGLPAIAWQNIEFTPVNGAPYIREKMVIVDESLATLCPPRVRATLLYLLDYFAPAGTDALAVHAAIQPILRAYAPRQTLIEGTQSFRIRQVQTKGPVHSPVWEQTPIEVRLIADTINPV